MNLNIFFQLSVSVFCVVATIFILAVSVWAVLLSVRVNKITKKIEEISEIIKDTSSDAKEFIDRTIQSLEAIKKSIFTFEFIRRIVIEVIDMVKNNRKQTK